MPRRVGKEIWVFVIGLAIVSCLGALKDVSKYGQDIESVVLFFKSFAIMFLGLLLAVAVTAVVLILALWVVLNKGTKTLSREMINHFTSRFK